MDYHPKDIVYVFQFPTIEAFFAFHNIAKIVEFKFSLLYLIDHLLLL